MYLVFILAWLVADVLSATVRPACSQTFAVRTIFSYAYEDCLAKNVTDVLAPGNPAHNAYTANTMSCVNRAIQAKYHTRTGLGMGRLGAGAIVSDAALELGLYIVPVIPRIGFYPGENCHSVELLFSIDMDPLPPGKYILLEANGIRIKYVKTMGYCERRHFEIEHLSGIQYADFLKYQYYWNEDDPYLESGKPIQLILVTDKTRYQNLNVFTLCLGVLNGRSPVCLDTTNSLDGFFSGDTFETTLSNSVLVMSMFYVASYDECLTESRATYLYEFTPFVIKRPPIRAVDFDNRTTITFPYIQVLANPTSQPTAAPTAFPTRSPTNKPTFVPTNAPTRQPTPPTSSPSFSPSTSPTAPTPPTKAPSNSPTVPTFAPSKAPTQSPTPPTFAPTQLPTGPTTPYPSQSPTTSPTPNPTAIPTLSPSNPTKFPTSVPTA